MQWLRTVLGYEKRGEAFRVIVPAEGSYKPRIKAAKVDLPEPDGPTTAVTFPAGRIRSTPLRTGVSLSG